MISRKNKRTSRRIKRSAKGKSKIETFTHAKTKIDVTIFGRNDKAFKTAKSFAKQFNGVYTGSGTYLPTMQRDVTYSFKDRKTANDFKKELRREFERREKAS